MASVAYPLGWLGASVLSPFLGHAIYVYGWRRLLHDADVRASYWHLARIFLVSNLGRYLPAGKAWQMAIVGMIAAESNLPAARRRCFRERMALASDCLCSS